MLNCIRKNVKVIPKNIRNDGKCPYCDTKNYLDINNNVINCLKCNKTFIFKYDGEKENIQKDNYDIFLGKNTTNAFI